MIKWMMAILAFFLALGLVWRLQSHSQPKTVTSAISVSPSPTEPPQKNVSETSAVFIPYWNIPSDLSDLPYDRFIYFGVSANASGNIVADSGLNGLSSFEQAAAGRATYLTLRMLNSDTNLEVLKNQPVRDRIISRTVALAKQHGFKGIVFDFELATLPFTQVQESINQFTEEFDTSANQNQLKFSVALYGDVFYRKRPFDVRFIASHSDEILVMAYDFHKPLGEPGPNFPLDGQDKYGYDFKEMIGDYLQMTTPEKLTVVFGMYGYDWTVDEKQKPLKSANSISLADIRKKFLDKCAWQNCLITPDAVSSETEIDYVDSSSSEFAINHIIWFEDERSVGIKKSYLKQQGIGHTALWVYGYF